MKCLSRWREGQIIGLLGREFTETIKWPRCPVDFAHRFQQQILQGGVKILPYEQAVARGKQVNIRIRNVANQADEPSPQHYVLQTGDRFGNSFSLRNVHYSNSGRIERALQEAGIQLTCN